MATPHASKYRIEQVKNDSLQTLFPLMFTFTPPLVAWTLALLQINLGEIVSLFGDIMSIAQVLLFKLQQIKIQVIDPLLVFYFIADYRRALLKLFSKRSYNGTIAPDTRETAGSYNIQKVLGCTLIL